MSDLPLVVFGAGGHGKVVADILLAGGQTPAGFVDDRLAAGSLVLGLPVLGPASWLDHTPARIALGVGDNRARAEVAAACVARGGTLVAAIHPSAVVARSARIEEGAVVMALAVINPDATIERGAIVNSGAVIEHDCVLGAFAHVSPNAALGGGCRIGACAHLGVGASMLPGTSIGERTVVGAGAVVTRALPPDAVAAGVPARVRRSR
jgi:sugar O-acyltransferase (sialic acid O-acetyltransferase NeuD family)